MNQTPLIGYQYYAWRVRDYDDWARQAAEHNDGLLEYERALHLEQIYSNTNIYNSDEHTNNIQWLTNLEYHLSHVWNYQQKTKAGMGQLVDDYKKYFELT